MYPPLGIYYSRLCEEARIDGKHGNDREEEGGRPAHEEVEDLGLSPYI